MSQSVVEDSYTRFPALRTEAERRLHEEPGAQQAVVLRSAMGGVYAFSLRDWTDAAPEDEVLHELRERGDTAIELLVCLWQQGLSPDLPSIRFRRSLLALDARNADTRILVNGEDADGRPALTAIRLGNVLK